MKKISVILLFVLFLASPIKSQGQETISETLRLPSKLQIAIEPEEIILTNDITVGMAKKKIQMIISELSGIKRAELELVARPFIDINTGDIVDVSTVTVGISTPQVSLAPGGLQRVELTIGGFRQAGTYIGGITIHDTVSGERKEMAIRVSVKDAWGAPIGVLLTSVLIASGVNHWTKKGKRKNRIDQKVAELQKTIKLAGAEGDLVLFDAEQLLQKAQEHNQEYQFAYAEGAIAGAEQKLAQYEQRKQGSELLRQKIQELLNEVRELGETDPQNSRISNELIQLLPKVQSDYEQTEAIAKQIEMFFRAYRLAKKDLQNAREKLFSSLEYVKKADKSKIELLLGDIDRILHSAESMSALDEANLLLRKVAFELSPEKINENMFRSQRLQKMLEEFKPQIRQITGTQTKSVVNMWYERAQVALDDNRFEDVDEAMQKLVKIIAIVEKMKAVESRIKGRDKKMTELRRIIRDCKTYLEGTSWQAILRADRDVLQVEEILDGIREHYEPFQMVDQQEPEVEAPQETPEDETESRFAEEARNMGTMEDEEAKIRPLTQEDLRRNLDLLMEEASQYSKLHGKIVQWRAYCNKLLGFDELKEMFDYLRLIQDELSLYARIQTIRAQAEAKHLNAVLRLTDQAEQLLLSDTQEERGNYHRAETLTDAAKALLEEKQSEGDLDQVISYIRSPKTASQIVTYGALASYYIAATALGFQILYAPNPDFGALLFQDYFSLILLALSLEGVKMTATNIYEAYFKKEG